MDVLRFIRDWFINDFYRWFGSDVDICWFWSIRGNLGIDLF